VFESRSVATVFGIPIADVIAGSLIALVNSFTLRLVLSLDMNAVSGGVAGRSREIEAMIAAHTEAMG
jgi:hypothetical protein